jgi:L,D-transpeptidase-like protein/putative peptidoglycan binding protein
VRKTLALPTLLVTALSVVVALTLPVTALAQTQTSSVTLSAAATKITIGHAVTLSGSIDPATAGETVEIRESSDALVASATTAADGSFSADVTPSGTRAYHAAWAGVTSAEVTVRVRATIDASMTTARLFDDVVVRGAVEPARPGRHVEVELRLGRTVVDTQRVEMGSAGRFEATFRVMQPGRYRARATFTGADLLTARDVTPPSSTPLPSLSTGSHGVYVRLLEQRLVELHYRLIDTDDGRYDDRTADAVVAFHKVKGMARTFTVEASTWRALADPRVPQPRYTWRGLHVEVDQTHQVAMIVVDGEITDIFHVSTGKPSTPTHDGLFRVNRKIAGYSGHQLYYPSYFDGNRALHGWPDVPSYPASHGCVRIPYWNAQWVYGLAPIGTRVAVYH